MAAVAFLAAPFLMYALMLALLLPFLVSRRLSPEPAET